MRPVRAFPAALAVFALSAFSGCDKPDVGSRCVLSWNPNWQQDGTAPPPTPSTAQGDYFESGNFTCEDLICIVSPAPASSQYGSCDGDACGYCSKPCVSNRDCYSSQTGLVCAQVVLDPVFIATLQNSDPDTLNRYLGDIRYTNYCVVPGQ